MGKLLDSFSPHCTYFPSPFTRLQTTKTCSHVFPSHHTSFFPFHITLVPYASWLRAGSGYHHHSFLIHPSLLSPQLWESLRRANMDMFVRGLKGGLSEPLKVGSRGGHWEHIGQSRAGVGTEGSGVLGMAGRSAKRGQMGEVVLGEVG